jgi:hypothetical protein
MLLSRNTTKPTRRRFGYSNKSRKKGPASKRDGALRASQINALAKIETDLPPLPEVRHLVEFVRASARGISK